jgi:hypothetical protein
LDGHGDGTKDHQRQQHHQQQGGGGGDCLSSRELELARLRAQLGHAEQECAMWRARAERAEERVRVLEEEEAAASEGGLLGVGVGNGISAGVESCVGGDSEVWTRGLVADDDGGKGEVEGEGDEDGDEMAYV